MRITGWLLIAIGVIVGLVLRIDRYARWAHLTDAEFTLQYWHISASVALAVIVGAILVRVDYERRR